MTTVESQGIEIIAEIGSVHDGSFGNALKLVECAAESGATVAKFQLHISSAETSENAPNPSYFNSESRYDYFNRIAFSKNQWVEIKERCHSLGIKFGCSPFSIEAVDFLLDVGVDILKIPSGEITNHPLIEYISETGRPIHISSGMSTWAEIDEAIAILNSVQDLCLMQCASMYPAPPLKIGLNNISEMKNRYESKRVSIGFSDHSTGIVMPIAAVALGARAIEKHLTFSRKMYGSDAFNALEPMEFKEMSLGIRSVEIALQNPIDKNNIEDFIENRLIFQKSIVAGRNVAKGESLSLECVKFLKPASGLLPSEWKKIMGRRINRNIPAGHLISFEDFE